MADFSNFSPDGGTTTYQVKDATARANIGNLSDLETTAKNSIVDAINEIVTDTVQLNQTITLSTTEQRTAVFTDSRITDSCAYTVYTDIYGVNPVNIEADGTNHTCTLTFEPYTSASTLNIILEFFDAGI